MTASRLRHIIFDVTGICVTAHSSPKICFIYVIRHKDMQLFSCHIPHEDKRKRQCFYFLYRDFTKNFLVCTRHMVKIKFRNQKRGKGWKEIIWNVMEERKRDGKQIKKLPRKVVYFKRQVCRIFYIWFYCFSVDKVTRKMEVLRLARSW